MGSTEPDESMINIMSRSGLHPQSTCDDVGGVSGLFAGADEDIVGEGDMGIVFGLFTGADVDVLVTLKLALVNTVTKRINTSNRVNGDMMIGVLTLSQCKFFSTQKVQWQLH